MINAIIIDDEQPCIDALRADHSRHCGNVDVAASCLSGKEGILAIKKNKPQLIFLDVEMPWMNGFEMLEIIEHIDFCIIFTTAFDKFAARAFRISAVDYLLKPVDINDLKTAVRKAEEKIIASSGVVNIETLLHNLKQPAQQQRIALPNRDGFEFAQINSILYCMAEGAYTRLVFSDKRTLLVSKTLGDIEEMLPAEFFVRIHYSTIVSLGAITHYVKTDSGYLVMNNQEKLAVSKARKEVLLERLGLKT